MSKEYIKQVYDLTLEKLKVNATIYEEYHEIESFKGNEVFILSGTYMYVIWIWILSSFPAHF